MIELKNIEKYYENGIVKTFVLRRIDLGNPRRGICIHHGTLWRWQINPIAHPGHAGHRLEWRVPFLQPRSSQTGRTRIDRTAPRPHRICISELPSHRRTNRLRKPGNPPLVSKSKRCRAQRAHCRNAGSLQHRGKKAAIPQPVIRWTTTTGRHSPGIDHAAKTDPGRRSQPAT